MPDKEQELAKLVLDRSLGTTNTSATLGTPSDLMQYVRPYKPNENPKIEERRIVPTVEARGRLFVNPNPEPYGPVDNSYIKEALKVIQQENPDAFKHMAGMHFAPLRGNDTGMFRGITNAGDFILDPAKAMGFHKEHPVLSLIDAIRHEMAHGLGYEDDYEAQPVNKMTGEYGRRPLDSSGKARDAQDVDLASHLLHRTDK